MKRVAKLCSSLVAIVCLSLLLACPAADSNNGGGEPDSESGQDVVEDGSDDTEDDDSEPDTFCTSEQVCCDENGDFVTSVQACDNSCPSGTTTVCSPEARCYDAPNSKPTCVGAEGEIEEAVCDDFETMSRWHCPVGTQPASSDAGMDGGS